MASTFTSIKNGSTTRNMAKMELLVIIKSSLFFQKFELVGRKRFKAILVAWGEIIRNFVLLLDLMSDTATTEKKGRLLFHDTVF